MNPEDDAPATTDEDFLDEVFERAVALCEDASRVDVESLLAGREHLRAQVEDLLQTARLVTPARSGVLPIVPGYALLAEIGRGGMGVVYLARQDALGGRHVALKVLPSSSELSPRSRDRFLAEAHAIAKLRHPSVVTVHDVVSGAGVLAYAMEWVDGASLGQVLDHLRARRALRSPDDTVSATAILDDVREVLGQGARIEAATYTILVCRIGIAIARALGELHRAGLVHRDVKPSNILLREDGAPLLSDFGLVHAADGELTRSGQFSGTIAYASPEQLDGDPESLDARSDIYALGTTIYHALALQLPFDDRRGKTRRATTPTGMLRLIEGGRAAPLRAWNRRLPRDLETIVSKAIEPDPAQRYAAADELADDLERMLRLQPIRARPSSWFARAAKLVRRNRAAAWGLGIGSVLSLALATALVVNVFLAPRWVEEHAREARLALIDPAQANGIFLATFFGVANEELDGRLRPQDSAFANALRHYDAALRWAPRDVPLRAEREVVSRVLARTESIDSTERTELASADALRTAGLLAYLRGEFEIALGHWERFEAAREPTAPPDALVEAAIGVLYLVREEPARAYPRLREACQAFPRVGFLTTYLADAALQCGDVQDAERLLEAASKMPRPDPYGAESRVLAALLAAQGRDAEAEAVYRAAPQGGPNLLQFARFLNSRGRLAESIDWYARIGAAPCSPRVRQECTAAIERWWTGVAPETRSESIHRMLDLDWNDPGSLIARLRAFTQPSPSDPASTQDRRAARGDTMTHFASFFAALLRGSSSPPLQNRSLADLSRTLEVHNMAQWNQIRTYSPLFKALQLQAWASPHPAQASQAVAGFAQWLRPRAAQLAFGAAVVASAGGIAPAQNCPNAPCFQGLGDLPGGNFMSFSTCISSDGTTVGGGSSTALSAGEHLDYEAFIWRADTGMVYLGDIPGQGEMGATQGLSADGSVAVGWSSSALGSYLPYGYPEAFRWTQAGGLVALGDLPGGSFNSRASRVSDDGLLIAGYGAGTSPFGDAWRAMTWTSATGWVVVGGNSTRQSFLFGLSRDGQWAAGRQDITWPGPIEGFRWSEFLGLEVLTSSTQPAEASGTAVSDGGVVVGVTSTPGGYDSWVRTPPGALQPLADLPGGANFAYAASIQRDGTLIVGFSHSAAGSEAVLWDESRSLHRVVDVLTGAGVAIPAGWTLTEAYDIVRNGNVITICGAGTNPAGQTEAWIARFDGYPTELFCFGDGTGSACPCGNSSPVGNDDGCLSSLGLGGRLRSTGTADVGADTLVLQGSQMPNSFALYFQGSTLVAGGSGSVFGDGLRCAGAIIRLGTKANASGASQYPDVGDPSVSVRGMVTAPGGWRYYQTWYRNAASFCTSSTFNLTNAARVFWTM